MSAVAYPRRFASLVKIEHTVFALPFAYVGALLAVGRVPSAHDLLWITVAMVGARSLAMALNRLIDAEHRRAQPAHGGTRAAGGPLTRLQVVVFCARVARRLPPRRLAARPARALAVADPGRGLRDLPVPEAVHVALATSGSARSTGSRRSAPGSRSPASCRWEAWALGAAVACWVAGFDLFYSLLDVEVDRREGLHSWATRFGEQGVFCGARAPARC